MVIFDDRTEMEVLDRSTSISLLGSATVGRVAFCAGDEVGSEAGAS